MTFLDAPAAAAPTSVPAIPAGPRRPGRFTGDTRAYWRLLIRGGVLLAVTLGIYRFWFATDVRRFLWSHSELDSDSFEYTGTPIELLLGFLIAIALLVPFYLIFFLVTLSMGPAGEAASGLGFLILAYLGQYAVYRARRYRLTRTVFRGVRFHQGGSAWRYAFCAIIWWAMILLTLGLAYPFAQSRLERFKMRHTYFGNLQGRFVGSGWRLLFRGLPMWLLVVGPLAFALMFALGTVDWNAVVRAASSASSEAEFVGQLGSEFANLYVAGVVAIVATAASVAMAALLFPAFQAMVLRWWVTGVRFGALTARSQLRTRTIYAAYGRFLLYGVLFLLAAAIVAAIGIGVFHIAFSANASSSDAEIAGAVGAVALYVVVMLGFSTIYQGTAKLALWRHGVESLELEGLEVLDKVKADGAPSSAVGEGLADALNVGGI